jgi:hypothetical protein
MAKALRIDSLELLGDGRVRLTYTRGATPLPLAKGGEGIIWSSKADAAQALDDAASRLDAEDLLLMLLAVWRRANPAMTNPSVVVGKTITFDLVPTGITITVT